MIIWLTFVAIFQVVAFVTPNEIAGMSKFTGGFWAGYIFIMLAFIGQLGIAWFSLKDGLEKGFYRIPVLLISYGALVAMLVVGILSMVIPSFPVWLEIIFCVLALGIGTVVMAQAQAVGDMVESVDIKIRNKTFFIQSLTVDLDALMARTEIEEIRKEIKGVYDTVRYSDPVSMEELAGIETQITLKAGELAESVENSDIKSIKKEVKEIQILLNERNKKCKLLK